jgi:hypothetical protein
LIYLVYILYHFCKLLFSKKIYQKEKNVIYFFVRKSNDIFLKKYN